MDNTDPKTLQTEIVKRFMSDAEWDEFQKEYWSSKKGIGDVNRARYLANEISKEDLDLLKVYVTDTDISVREMKSTVTYKNIGYRVGRKALRVLHQHPELLQRI